MTEETTRKPGAARMKDVAERAGVSMMTVSLALRESENAASPRMSPETRARVLQAIKELNYVPNARARGLRSGTTNIIGLYAGYGLVNVRVPYFTEIVSGAQEGCESYGRDLLLHSSFRNRQVEEIYNELRDGRIDGLIVNMPMSNPLTGYLRNTQLPVVAVADPIPGVPSVVVDDGQGSRLIARHLHEKGHKHCLYRMSSIEAISAARRRHSFLQSADELGIVVEELDGSNSANGTEDLLARWFSFPTAKRPTAVVCWNDTSAYSFLVACGQRGIRVPDDIAVIGFDGCPTPYHDPWTLTTVRAPWALAARTAVETLESLRQGDPIPPETILPVELIPGKTS